MRVLALQTEMNNPIKGSLINKSEEKVEQIQLQALVKTKKTITFARYY